MGPFAFVGREGFASAFLVAAAACAIVAVAALALQRVRGTSRVLPVGGLVGVGAAVFALEETDAVLGDAGSLYRGLAALVLAGLATALPRIPWFVRLVAVIPGAVLIGDAAQSAVAHSPADRGWVGPVAGAAVALGATAFVSFDRRYARTGLGPVLLAITAGGVFLCVPDTEQALPLLGASLAVGFLGWPKPLASVGAAGACATVGLVVWTAAAGGRGRPGSIIGAIACLGILALEPPIRSQLRARAGRAPLGPWTREAVVIAGLHLAVVMLCSRVAGLRSSAMVAAVVVVVVFSAAGLLLWRRILPTRASAQDDEPPHA